MSVVLSSLSVATHAAVPLGTVVYAICMSERHLRGVPVSDEQIQAWADEAERGYDLTDLPSPRPGRPPVGKGPGSRSVSTTDRHLQYGNPTLNGLAKCTDPSPPDQAKNIQH